VGESLKEFFELDVKAEEEAITLYKKIVEQAQKEADVTTALIFKEILEDDEEHHNLITIMPEGVQAPLYNGVSCIGNSKEPIWRSILPIHSLENKVGALLDMKAQGLYTRDPESLVWPDPLDRPPLRWLKRSLINILNLKGE
jgi:hypothetical protein